MEQQAVLLIRCSKLLLGVIFRVFIRSYDGLAGRENVRICKSQWRLQYYIPGFYSKTFIVALGFICYNKNHYYLHHVDIYWSRKTVKFLLTQMEFPQTSILLLDIRIALLQQLIKIWKQINSYSCHGVPNWWHIYFI